MGNVRSRTLCALVVASAMASSCQQECILEGDPMEAVPEAGGQVLLSTEVPPGLLPSQDAARSVDTYTSAEEYRLAAGLSVSDALQDPFYTTMLSWDLTRSFPFDRSFVVSPHVRGRRTGVPGTCVKGAVLGEVVQVGAVPWLNEFIRIDDDPSCEEAVEYRLFVLMDDRIDDVRFNPVWVRPDCDDLAVFGLLPGLDAEAAALLERPVSDCTSLEPGNCPSTPGECGECSEAAHRTLDIDGLCELESGTFCSPGSVDDGSEEVCAVNYDQARMVGGVVNPSAAANLRCTEGFVPCTGLEEAYLESNQVFDCEPG